MRGVSKVALSLAVVAMFAMPALSADWANSEGSAYAKGDKLLSVGMSLFHFGAYAAFDMGFHDCISGGVASGYQTYSYNDYFRYHYIPIVVRAAFHPFNLAMLADKIAVREKLDAFIGPTVGYSIGWHSTKKDLGIGIIKPSGLGFPVIREYIGIRFFFTENLAVFAEEGGGMGWLNAGLTFKF